MHSLLRGEEEQKQVAGLIELHVHAFQDVQQHFGLRIFVTTLPQVTPDAEERFAHARFQVPAAEDISRVNTRARQVFKIHAFTGTTTDFQTL